MLQKFIFELIQINVIITCINTTHLYYPINNIILSMYNKLNFFVLLLSMIGITSSIFGMTNTVSSKNFLISFDFDPNNQEKKSTWYNTATGEEVTFQISLRDYFFGSASLETTPQNAPSCLFVQQRFIKFNISNINASINDFITNARESKKPLYILHRPPSPILGQPQPITNDLYRECIYIVNINPIIIINPKNTPITTVQENQTQAMQSNGENPPLYNSCSTTIELIQSADNTTTPNEILSDTTKNNNYKNLHVDNPSLETTTTIKSTDNRSALNNTTTDLFQTIKPELSFNNFLFVIKITGSIPFIAIIFVLYTYCIK